MNRRELLLMGGTVLAAGLGARQAFSQAGAAASKLKIGVNSANLQWLRSADDVAKACIETSFEGVDLTVRANGGHVDPARVGADLAPFINTLRGRGLTVDTIHCDIVDADSPMAESILTAAAAAGIRQYSCAGLQYDLTRPIPAQLDAFKPRIQRLVALNDRLGLKAMYRPATGGGAVGANGFDMLSLLRDFDPRRVGVHYDTGRAAVAGGGGAWEPALRALGPYLAGVSVTDALLRLNISTPGGGPFTGQPAAPAGGRGGGAPPAAGAPAAAQGAAAAGGRGGAPGGAPPAAAPGGLAPGGRGGAPGAGAPPAVAAAGRGGGLLAAAGAAGRPATVPVSPRGGGGATNPWLVVPVPVGSGLVDLPRLATALRDIGFQGPVEIRGDYPNGGAEAGAQRLTTFTPPMVLGALKRDLLTVRAVFGPTGLI